MPTELRLIRAYYGYGRPIGNSYGRTTATGMGVLRLWLRAYYNYGYGRTTTTATGVLRLWLRAYYDYGYGRTTTTATGVLRLRLRAYYDYGYGRTTTTATGVLRLWLRAYYDYGYGRTTTTATGVLRLRLRANVRAYYVNFFTAYTVYNLMAERSLIQSPSVWLPVDLPPFLFSCYFKRLLSDNTDCL